MAKSSRLTAAAAVILGLLCVSAASAQSGRLDPVARLATAASGAIRGVVTDENGAPVFGAMVTAVGATMASATTDRAGRYEFQMLSPGPYFVRAHLSGFIVPRGQLVQVTPGARSASSIAIRRASALAVQPSVLPASAALPPPDSGSEAASTSEPPATGDSEAKDEAAWRLRHARRSILKDALDGAALIAQNSPDRGTDLFGTPRVMAVAISTPARAASSFFGETPFVGQVNLLTTGSFDLPQELFTTRSFERNVAYMSVGAPAGDRADWTVSGAVTQGDISSWLVSGEYLTRAPARHRYNVGLSYSAQRYDGGNPAALRNVTDGSRNAGAVHGFDTFAIAPALSVTYGARYARYDYLESSGLLSPRVSLTLTPAEHFRVSTLVSSRAIAPGAEEFVPPSTGLWLPPQRTFSSLIESRPLVAERVNHVEAEVERDLTPAATITMRAFRQNVEGQLVTLFGVNLAGRPPSSLGHYFVADGGDVATVGYSAGIKAVLAERVHGSLDYTIAHAEWDYSRDLTYLVLFSPSLVRSRSEQIHDVSASIQADVPETSTRVYVLYRVSNGFARRSVGDRQAFDSRFDVQVRQSLPFMDFSSARWEMLIAVRDFFREAVAGESMYDELLVVRAPKRVVGGLTVRF